MARFHAILIPPGTHTSPDGVVDATPARLARWADQFRKMRDAGIRVPVSWGHGPDALPIETEAEYQRSIATHNAGYCLDMSVDPRTNELVFEGDCPGVEVDPESGNLVHWVRLPDGREVKGAIGEVSAGINTWRDGKARTWRDSIIHVGLTPLPVVSGQKGFRALSGLRRPSPLPPDIAGRGQLLGWPTYLSTMSVVIARVPSGGLAYGPKRLPGGYRLSLWQLSELDRRAQSGDGPARAFLIRLGWDKRGKTSGGKTRWIGNAEDAGKTRYQESEPGTWSAKHRERREHATNWHQIADHEDFASRLREQHGEHEADASSVNRAYGVLAHHHGTGDRLMLRLRQKAAEYAWVLKDAESSPIQQTMARQRLHGLARMLERAQTAGIIERAMAGAEEKPAKAAGPDLTAFSADNPLLRGVPALAEGGIASMKELRKQTPDVSQEDFNRGILALVKTGLVIPQREGFPAYRTAEDLAQMVRVGTNEEGTPVYYGAIALRMGDPKVQALVKELQSAPTPAAAAEDVGAGIVHHPPYGERPGYEPVVEEKTAETPVAVKEPWQMTLDEFRESLRGKKIDKTASAGGQGRHNREGTIQDLHRQATIAAYQLGKPVSWDNLARHLNSIESSGFRQRLENHIKDDLIAGKEVPESVLRRYPSIAQKYKRPVTAPASEPPPSPATAETDLPETAAEGVPADARPKEPLFTGTTTDSLGRIYHWRNGKRIKSPEELPDEDLARTSEASPGGGLPAEQSVGADAGAAPEAVLPGPGAGIGGGPGSLPAGADVVGNGLGGPAGERGDRLPRGASGGPGSPAADASGRTGPTGGVGDGGGLADDGVGSGASPAEESLAEPPTPENPTDVAAGNWHYTDRDFATGGLKAKFRNNLEAIRTLKGIQAEGRTSATPEEQAILSKYVGWGQFPALFNQYEYEWKKERDLLRSFISQEEWDAARGSTLNAHYTAPAVVDAHWQMARRLGYTGGRFLETSAGIGYYLGLMPEDLTQKTRSSAVELDSLTGGMLKLLYPATNVKVQGFEEHQAPDGFYDLVASNVPFGDYKVHDPRYNKHQANIHDYFFLKSVDLARPGGLVMHITSTGTLDKLDPKIRSELAKTCDLVSAIRFPAGAHKEGAGTDVVTDLLVLRKRMPGEEPVGADTPAEAEPREPGYTGTTTDSLGRLYHWKDGVRVPGSDWTKTTTIPDPAGGEPIPVNQYFADHPEQILGTLDRSGTMYRGNSINVAKTDDFDARLQAAIERLPEGVMKPAAAFTGKRFTADVMPAPGDVKEGGYAVKDGKVYVREGGALVEQKLEGKALARLQGHLGIRDALRGLINDQLQGRDATASRAKLNAVYDAFIKKHGFLSDNANKRVFRTDPDAPVLLALEKYDAKAKKATKADIFAKDTIRHVAAVQKAGTVGEALGVSLHETGGVDVERMAALTGQSVEQVGRALVEQGIAFQDPTEGWKPGDQYLSGNVRKKLALARAAAAADPKFAPNVAALEAVQPEDIDHEDIEARLGATWVPPSDVKAFCAHLLGGRSEHFAIDYVPAAGQWLADFSRDGRWVSQSQQAKQVWATDRKDFATILESALNNMSLTVWDKGENDTPVVNRQATDDANAKMQEMKEAFKTWIWDDPERRDRLHRYYNDHFNCVRNISYDGSHQTFPGMNPSFQLRDHQKNFVWQTVTTGRGLAAHEVGTGKTATLVASAMELRRLGLAKKPAIACKKANIEQITREALELYPGAKILSTADMFDAASRKKTISQIATGDYDLVLLTHDHLDLLQMKPEVVQAYIKDEIAELEAAAAASRQANPKKDNRVVKALEKAKKNLEARLEKSLESTGKDDAVSFEETGIDHLLVDEAHAFKSLPCATKQRGLKGVPTSRSDRATSMQMRTRWLMEQNGGRGVTFATGTPVTNTMAELFNMQRYLQPLELKERGIANFDAWAAAFGDVQTKMEFSVTGEYKPVARFARFVNIPELMQMARQVMDVQRADGMTKEDGSSVIVRPKRKDSVVVAPKSKAMEQLMASLQSRARALRGNPEKGADNMLSICSDGRKGALDMRLLDPNAADDPGSKVNQCVGKVLELHKTKPGVVQLIFSDVGVNPQKMYGFDDEGGDDTEESAGGFHVYGDIIDKLVAGGIPREKIADFSKLKGAKKEAAMEAMRKGEILIGIGSTDKLGTGVNVQNKLAALHHLDVPWVPASVEQRDGRAWRQGNENKNIDIYRYVSEGSLDQTFWQIIGNKAGFIKQVMTPGQSVGRVAKDEDTEELTPEQLMAAASGDPRILQKVNLDEELKQLRSAEVRHGREQTKLKDAVATGERRIPGLERIAKELREDARHLEARPDFHLEMGGKTYTDRKEGTEAFNARLEELAGQDSWRPQNVGTYRGMDLVRTDGKIALRSPAGRLYPTGPSLLSVESVARRMPKDAEAAEQEVPRARADIERTREQLGKTFPKAEELRQKVEQSRRLELELAGKNPDATADVTGAAPAGAGTLAEPLPAPPSPEPVRIAGNTFEHKERIKAAGGRFDDATKTWLVSPQAAERLRTLPGLRFGDEPAPATGSGEAGVAASSAPPAKRYTESSRAAVHEALRLMAAQDTDRARERNMAGFNQMDTAFGGQLAETESLTDRQVEAAANMLRKYKRQIPPELYEKILNLAEAEPAVAAAAPLLTLGTRRVQTSEGERHVYSFAFSDPIQRLFHSGTRPNYLSAQKNDRTGQWEAAVWGTTPAEVAANHQRLQQLTGTRLSVSPRVVTLVSRAETGDEPARLSLVRLGWTQQTSRSGGTKWIGKNDETGQHAGQTRYQEKMPGTGRTAKADTAAAVPTGQPAAPFAPKSHADLIAHLTQHHGDATIDDASVARSYGQLKKHGDKLLSKLSVQAGAVLKKLGSLKPDDPKAEGLRGDLRKIRGIAEAHVKATAPKPEPKSKPASEPWPADADGLTANLQPLYGDVKLSEADQKATNRAYGQIGRNRSPEQVLARLTELARKEAGVLGEAKGKEEQDKSRRRLAGIADMVGRAGKEVVSGTAPAPSTAEGKSEPFASAATGEPDTPKGRGPKLPPAGQPIRLHPKDSEITRLNKNEHNTQLKRAQGFRAQEAQAQTRFEKIRDERDKQRLIAEDPLMTGTVGKQKRDEARQEMARLDKDLGGVQEELGKARGKALEYEQKAADARKELEASRGTTGTAGKDQPAKPASFDPAPHHAPTLDAVRKLDPQGDNLVSFVGLRQEMARNGVTDHDQQDAVLASLRKSGKLSLTPYEGRHGITPEQHAAGIKDGGTGQMFGYASLREK